MRERSLVPEPEFESYYGRPVLKAPVWKQPDVPLYLFLGGYAGVSALLAEGAEATGRAGLSRVARLGAAAGAGLGTVALIHDLGRPERFLNMLRTFKVTSPLSVGSWVLAPFSSLASAAALSTLTGRLPLTRPRRRGGRRCARGPARDVHRCADHQHRGAGVARRLPRDAVPVRRERRGRRRWRSAGARAARRERAGAQGGGGRNRRGARRPPAAAPAPGHGGRAVHARGVQGTLLRAARVLEGVGAAGALLGRRSRTLSVMSGAALVAGSVLTRFGIFQGGVASAKDPKYTVVPQRERAAARAGGVGGGQAGRSCRRRCSGWSPRSGTSATDR